MSPVIWLPYATVGSRAAGGGGDSSLVTAILAAGGTLSPAQKIAVDNRLAALDTDIGLSNVVAHYGFAGGTAASHLINWVNPGTDDITWVGALTHGATGVDSPGTTTDYGQLPFAPSDFPQDDLAIAFYLNVSNPSGASFLIGSRETTTSPEYSRIFYDGFNRVGHGLNSSGTDRVSQGNGYNSGIRSSSTDVRINVNGAISNVTETSTPRSTQPYYLFARNNAGTADLPLNCLLKSITFFSNAISSAEDTDNQASEEAYQAAMGR